LLQIFRLFMFILLTIFFSACSSKYENSLQTKVELKEKNWESPKPIQNNPQYLNLANNPFLKKFLLQVEKNNPDLQATKALIKSLESTKKAISATNKPSINLNFSANKNYEKYNEPKIEDEVSLSTDISWSLDLWGKIKDEIKASKLKKEQEEFNYLHLKRVLLAEAIILYIDYNAISETLLKIDGIEANSKILLHSLKKSYLDGMENLQNYNEAKINLNKIQALKKEYLFNKKNTLIKLNLLRGFEPYSKLALEKIDIKNILIKLPKEFHSSEILKRADVISSYKELKVLDYETKSAYKALLPQFSLSANFSKNAQNFNNILSGNTLWHLVGGITQPIFNAGELEALAKAKSQEAQSSFWKYKKTILEALGEVESLLASNNTIKQKYFLYTKNTQLKNNNLLSLHTQYENGQTSINEVLDSRSNLLESQYLLKELEADYIKKRISLTLAMGYSFENLLRNNNEK